jgi:hypothetical protein
MIAQQAAGFSLNVRDPEGINLRASRIIISGVNDHAPHADETAAHSLFVGAKSNLDLKFRYSNWSPHNQYIRSRYCDKDFQWNYV